MARPQRREANLAADEIDDVAQDGHFSPADLVVADLNGVPAQGAVEVLLLVAAPGQNPHSVDFAPRSQVDIGIEIQGVDRRIPRGIQIAVEHLRAVGDLVLGQILAAHLFEDNAAG